MVKLSDFNKMQPEVKPEKLEGPSTLHFTFALEVLRRCSKKQKKDKIIIILFPNCQCESPLKRLMILFLLNIMKPR